MKFVVIILFSGFYFMSHVSADVENDIVSVVNLDGTLNLTTGFSGSLDLSKSRVILGPKNGPVLSPPVLSPDWYPLGPGLEGTVFVIQILGNDVYAGGEFTNAGGDPDADFIARWDGCEWHPVGPGLDGPVRAIELNGGNIYVGGDFTSPINHIGLWDGVQWNGMGSGLNGSVYTLASSGDDIYAGGLFTDAGGNANGDYAAQWNGSSWINLGPGLNDEVFDIEINGNDVYACGKFLNAGGNPDADAISRWDGTSWNNLGPAFGSGMYELGIFHVELDGNNVYINGYWGSDGYYQMAYWDGNEWHSLAYLGFAVDAMLIYGDNIFTSTRTSDCAWLRRYDINGQYWEQLPGGCFYVWVFAFAYNGIDLYAGGDFVYSPNYSCPECNIMRYGEPDGIIPLIPDIPSAICEDDPPLALSTNQSGYTGEWSGEGITNNIFDPSGLMGEIPLTFTPDPGQCVSPVDTFITVITCAPPPCPSAGDDISVQMCSQEFLNFFLWTVIPNSDPWGQWLPPLDPQYYAGFDPCFHEEGTYYYFVSEPGCPNDTAVVTIDVTTWDPCGWYELIYAECVGIGDPNTCFDDTILITVPPIPGYHDGMTYSLILYNGTLISGVGNYDLTSTFLIAMDSTLWYCCPAINIQDDDTQCEAFNILNDICIPVEPCDNPPCPSAGVDITVSGCPTNLTPENILSYLNADTGGTWDPPLFGYTACIDGEGSYTYTQDNPGCPIEQATIIFDWTWDPCDWELEGLCLTGDEGSFTIPAFEGDHPGSTYTVHSNEINIMPMTGSLDESTDFTFSWLNWNCTPGCITIWVTINEDPSCEYAFGESDPGCAGWYLCDLPLCNCVDPPYAGEDGSISICDDNAPFDLTTSLGGDPDPGGNWTPVLNSGSNIYNPLLDGTGIFIYTVSSSECPDDQATVTVTVQSIAPALLIGIPSTVCENALPIVLSPIQNGINGNWSGIGVFNNIFNPQGLNGNITITFTPDPNQCTSPASTNIEVTPFIILTISGVPDTLCQTAQPVALPTSQSGIMGDWSGIGVTNNIFNPTGLSGNIVIVFTPMANACADPASTILYVSPASMPMIAGVPDSLCQTDPAVNLPGNQSGFSGNWSGNGVTNNTFNPSGLSGIIALTFISDPGQCATNATTNILIQQSLTPSISGVPAIVCEADPAIVLPIVQDGFAGDWAGPGVSNNVFDPSGLIGTIMLEFTPDTGLCANPTSTEINIELAIVPVISGVPNQLCEFSGLIQLPIVQDGITGNWSGTSVSNNTFNPAGLNGNIVLSFIPNTGQCAYNAMTSINIQNLVPPVITGVPSSLCETADSIDLPATLSGIHGNWSGQGVVNASFDPAGLSGMIQLFFTPDTGQCAASVNTSIVVNDPPSFQNLVATCDSLSQSYVVNFDIIGGLPGTYTVDGIQVNGSGFVSMPIDGDSIQYSFALDDVNGCGPVVIAGSKNCACATYSGTMDFTNAPLKVCVGSLFSGLHHGDQQLDPDDVLAFVLHDNAGTQLGMIQSISSTPSFVVPPGVILGQTYFLSSFAGSNDGSGSIDLTDECLSVSQGIPVVFYQPGASISQGGDICASSCFTYQLQLEGEKPFILDYQLIVNGMPIPGSINSDTNVVILTVCPADYGMTSGSMNIALINLTDIHCSVPLSPGTGTEILVHPEVVSAFNANLCNGESIIINNTLYNQSNAAGVEIIPGGSVEGCDSIIQVSLAFYPDALLNLHETLCFGSNLIINGTVYDESNPTGIEVFPNSSFFGCDSIVHIQLSFDSILTTDVSLTLCAGESMLINGTVYDENHPSGSELFAEGSVLGCDSLVNFSLTFNPLSSSFVSETLCAGEFVMVNGNLYDEQHPIGIEILPDANVAGCDSTVFISLNFYPDVILMIDDTLLVGDSLIFNGVIYNHGHASGIETIENGSVNGCDSIILVNLHFISTELTADIETVSPVCYGENSGVILINAVYGGFSSYAVSLDLGTPVTIDVLPYQFTGLSAGMHTIWIQDANGNSTPFLQEIEILNPSLITADAGPDQIITSGEDALLNATASLSTVTWSWSPLDFLTCGDCPDPEVVMPNHDIMYTIEVTDMNGCSASDDVYLHIEREDEIFFPNVFSPNGDGNNDNWVISSSDLSARILKLQIFDRWGGLVIEKSNLNINSPQWVWDGTSNGRMQNPGVYVFVSVIEMSDGRIIHTRGDITLVK